SSVAFYGCKVTPEHVQHALLCVTELAASLGAYALHPYEDARANKRLELYVELTRDLDGICADAVGRTVWRELAAVNQDFRESIKMVPAECRPTVRLFRPGASPMSGQDPRIKRRYIV